MVQPLPKMQSNPLAAIQAFTQPRRNQLAGLASGLLSSPNFGQGLSAGFAQAAQGRQVDDLYAQTQAETAQRQEQLAKTISYLRTQPGGSTWADAVENGLADPKDAFKAWYDASQPKKPQFQEVGGKLVKIDGENISTAYDPFAATGGVDPKEVFNREKDLYSQYSGADPVKAYEAVKGGYERVRNGAQLNSGAGDMSLIYGFMKMQDPGSVVRESEFAMAAQAGSFGEQIQGLVGRVLKGERLPESVRQQFVDAADGLYAEATANLTPLNDQFTKRASEYGVDPTRFLRVPETFDPVKTKPAASGSGLSGTTSTGVGWSFN